MVSWPWIPCGLVTSEPHYCCNRKFISCDSLTAIKGDKNNITQHCFPSNAVTFNPSLVAPSPTLDPDDLFFLLLPLQMRVWAAAPGTMDQALWAQPALSTCRIARTGWSRLAARPTTLPAPLMPFRRCWPRRPSAT